MENRVLSSVVLGLAVFLTALPLSRGLAGEAEKKEPAPATEEKKEVAAPEKPAAEKPAGLVGRIVAVVPESRTLVVDVPLGKEVLRIGAGVTEKTKITAEGKAISLESLKPGARVRLNFRRVATGDEAISVEVLRGARG
ncbi:MAG: hypothetical protein ACHQ7N_22220 [Candidatus Methylomirabilales bacterium]